MYLENLCFICFVCIVKNKHTGVGVLSLKKDNYFSRNSETRSYTPFQFLTRKCVLRF